MKRYPLGIRSCRTFCSRLSRRLTILCPGQNWTLGHCYSPFGFHVYFSVIIKYSCDYPHLPQHKKRKSMCYLHQNIKKVLCYLYQNKEKTVLPAPDHTKEPVLPVPKQKERAALHVPENEERARVACTITRRKYLSGSSAYRNIKKQLKNFSYPYWNKNLSRLAKYKERTLASHAEL